MQCYTRFMFNRAYASIPTVNLLLRTRYTSLPTCFTPSLPLRHIHAPTIRAFSRSFAVKAQNSKTASNSRPSKIVRKKNDAKTSLSTSRKASTKKPTASPQDDSDNIFPITSTLSNKSKRKSPPLHTSAQSQPSIESSSSPSSSPALHNSTPRSATAATTATASSSSSSSSSSELSLDQIYQKKTPREHILHRPETYVGSMQKETRMMWVVEDDTDTHSIVAKQVTYVPALLHIFDEILVNAADNRHRNNTKAGIVMSTIKVNIDAEKNEISIYNDGAAIPILLHPTEKILIPELIFFHLLTSSNYNDTQQRFTGGRHGYGAKLTNIFSSFFTIEIQDTVNGKYYKQTFRKNMSEKSAPIIKDLSTSSSSSSSSSYTQITFSPDLSQFHESCLSADMLSLMKRRVYDIAACVCDHSIKVYLNDKLIPIKSVTDYLHCFVELRQEEESESKEEEKIESEDDEQDELVKSPVKNKRKFVFSHVNDHWQIAAGPCFPSASLAAPSSSAATHHPSSSSSCSSAPIVNPLSRDISFVNCIATPRGGTHVIYIADRIAKYLYDYITKHYSKSLSTTSSSASNTLSLSFIKSHLSLFVNATISNPSFDSQTKDILLTPIKSTNTTVPILSDKFLHSLVKQTAIVDEIVEHIQSKQMRELNKKTKTKKGKILNIAKLDDANWAGTARASECTLILTEGDSAKALVLSGMNILGRDRYGVFPLKGKMLNVRDASMNTIMKNEEIQHICTILGLQHGRTYDTMESRRELRYGRVMLMTDQDHDGSHIKGLFINMIHTFWPSLLQKNDFLEEFVTAIIKVTKGKETKMFNTIPEFNAWKASMNEYELKKWHIKYYKGLGTNTAAEGKAYFNALSKHRITFLWGGEMDEELINMAFSKHHTNTRKQWLNSYNADLHVDHSQQTLTYSTFINRELILFSHADNIRSIPSAIDGLKPVQRKILYACFKRTLNKEIKVAQLSGYVSEQTGYHHGEVSLHGTIVNMAQNFVGSNNIPLLVPNGQFGTRHLGGKDAASARYIFTYLSEITRELFHPADDPLLTYKDEDGLSVEPEWYVPIIPLVLVNGAQGIGTGFSTDIPLYNPLDIVRNLRSKLAASPQTPLMPYVLGYRGSITPSPISPSDTFVCEGIIRMTNDTTVEITELPPGRWTQDYKEWLLSIVNAEITADMKYASIKRFHEYHTSDHVCFRIEMTEEQMEAAMEIGLTKAFKLITTITTNNMHCFDANGKIKRYANPVEIIDEFYSVRLQFYEKRKSYLLHQYQVSLSRSTNRMNFITAFTSGTLKLHNKKKHDLMQELLQLGYTPAHMFGVGETSPTNNNSTSNVRNIATSAPPSSSSTPSTSNSTTSTNSATTLFPDSYDYLLNLPISTLTHERLHALEQQLHNIQTQVTTLQASTIKQLYEHDLNDVEEHLRRLMEERKSSMMEIENSTGGINKKRTKRSLKHVEIAEAGAEHVDSAAVDEFVTQ